MYIIICLDDNNGLAFNHRRQSQDRIVAEDIRKTVGEKKLWITDYSRKLFQAVSNLEISENQKLHQAGAEIEFPAIFGFVPWRHHVEIVTKCKTIEEALLYVRKTIEESWSRSTLVDCIKANLYQSSGNALTNFAENLPAIQGKLAQEIVKDTYDFGFVSLPVGYDEEELEDALEQNITRFLLELGSGFAFIGRQKEIIVAGKTRKIDMLFYHIRGSVGFSGNKDSYGSCNLR